MVSINRRPCLRTGVALAFLALAGTACTEEPSSGAADSADPGIGHVHGLGVDPADGTVYVAGHYGLFQIRSTNTARRMADRIQDHMGFTVVGPRTFLASGHPGEADASSGVSPHLGLIRTTDAGATWTSVSEAGTADFHAIQPAGATLYAYDSQKGQIRRSGDQGKSWVPGARAEVIDLAAHHEKPNRVYATTPTGLRVSDDGGVNFTALADSPLMSHVDSVGKDDLVGAGTDGQVHTSRDSGRTWQVAGRLPGQVAAFAAVDRQRLLAAMEDATVVESTDGGRRFSVIYRPASS
ncbi:F510_1955 family glycosylhydrolase [Streptosporangium sp. NPDC005286]|uniref:F510_1955 family glycosylhydrolase n=1 Tax=Streptosporangium sp. NPDC005286 TaxID=3154463 RepID=UPI0033B9FF5A